MHSKKKKKKITQKQTNKQTKTKPLKTATVKASRLFSEKILKSEMKKL